MRSLKNWSETLSCKIWFLDLIIIRINLGDEPSIRKIEGVTWNFVNQVETFWLFNNLGRCCGWHLGKTPTCWLIALVHGWSIQVSLCIAKHWTSLQFPVVLKYIWCIIWCIWLRFSGLVQWFGAMCCTAMYCLVCLVVHLTHWCSSHWYTILYSAPPFTSGSTLRGKLVLHQTWHTSAWCNHNLKLVLLQWRWCIGALVHQTGASRWEIKTGATALKVVLAQQWQCGSGVCVGSASRQTSLSATYAFTHHGTNSRDNILRWNWATKIWWYMTIWWYESIQS